MKRVTWMKGASALLMVLSLVATPVISGTVDEQLVAYQADGAGDFSAERGKELWFKDFVSSEDGKPRSCTSCHTTNVRVNGKHAKTGKSIKPMAPAVNPERYTDAAKIEKWFKRNCKWTMDRECTPQEKGDFLSYLRQL